MRRRAGTIDVSVLFRVGLQLSHLLALGGGAVFILLLISILWNYCADDESAADQPTKKTKQTEKSEQVVVAEVRPGLILIRGSPNSQETLRIVQEYDAMANHSRVPPPPPGHDSAYFYGVAQGMIPAHSAGMNVFDGAAAPPLQQPSATELIDFEGDIRPPPYAPPEASYPGPRQS